LYFAATGSGSGLFVEFERGIMYVKGSINFALFLSLGILLGSMAHGVTATGQAFAAQAPDCEKMHTMMRSQMLSDADKAMMGAMMGMDRSMMNAKMTGNADRDFMLMMIPHHQSAIDMARAELKYGTDARVRALATNVISAQQKEINEMHSWLGSSAH
jgi:uncharacterized protein (DUF305 family)